MFVNIDRERKNRSKKSTFEIRSFEDFKEVVDKWIPWDVFVTVVIFGFFALIALVVIKA